MALMCLSKVAKEAAERMQSEAACGELAVVWMR
jgi:hypothetical protein